jgi:flagellar biosynthetic protein FliR
VTCRRFEEEFTIDPALFDLLKFERLLPAFALVLARMAGLVMALPLLTSQQVPRIVKASLIVIMSLVVFPVVAPLLPHSLTLGQAAAGMVGELVVGLVLGLGASMVFMAAQVAGKLVSHQSAMALSASYNPIMNASSTVLDQIWFFAVLMFFLAMHGHIAVIKSVLSSFQQVPPMKMFVDGALGEFVIGILRSTFDLALRLSGPGIVALLLTSLVMGFLTKTMPQLNILSVGFSFKIAVGLFILAVTIPFSREMVAGGVLSGLDQVGIFFEYCSETVTNAR